MVQREGFLYDEEFETQRRVLEALRLLAPFDVEGFRKVRLGRPHDGGYVMLDDFGSSEVAYSFGINDDVSWDRDVAALGLDVYQYDHTIDALPEENDRFHWSRLGLSHEPSATMRTLPDLIGGNGHGGNRDLILKLDIEGSEWDVVPSLPPSCLDQFRQIVMEIHGLCYIGLPGWYERILPTCQALARRHRVVHVHANNCAAYSVVGLVPVPAALEVTFVRADSDKVFTPFQGVFPTELDMPCAPSLPDLHLGAFRF